MLDLSNVDFNLLKDINNIIESEKIDIETLAKATGISKVTLNGIAKGKKTTKQVCEKFYSYIYDIGYRINLVKEEFLKETNKKILFHGSKNGLSIVRADGSRKNCDFGEGFYLGETYASTTSFICENSDACVYSFELSTKGLKIVNFSCSLEWMLAICYFRGSIKDYDNHETIIQIINKIKDADVVIAPIADNRMFYIMTQFANGDITDSVAIHSLSASSLGSQYILKTDKSINNLKIIEKYYVSENEKADYIKQLNQRTEMIETKLKLAKREYKEGLYIEEVLK